MFSFYFCLSLIRIFHSVHNFPPVWLTEFHSSVTWGSSRAFQNGKDLKNKAPFWQPSLLLAHASYSYRRISSFRFLWFSFRYLDRFMLYFGECLALSLDTWNNSFYFWCHGKISYHAHPQNLRDVYFLYCLRSYGLPLILQSLCTTQWVQKRPLQMFLIDAVHHSDFHRLLSLLYQCLFWLFSRSQTHVWVLRLSPCTGCASLLHGILPVGHCETGAMPQRPGAYCIKRRGMSIWGKIRISLLANLLKSEIWDFVLKGLLMSKVWWALWN